MILEDNDLMPEGKYRGIKMANVPADYLLWYKDNVCPTYDNDAIHNYIKDNLSILENEIKRTI